MKNSDPTISYILAVLVLISSCTMQKRHYMSGNHIEWKKYSHGKNHQEVSGTSQYRNVEPNSTIECAPLSKVSSVNRKASLTENWNPVITASVKQSLNESKCVKQIKGAHLQRGVLEKIDGAKKQNSKVSVSEESNEKVVAGEAIASLILGLLGVFYGITSLFAIFYGLKALAIIKYDEETYDGRGLAVVGIALGIIFIAIWCFLFVSF